MTTWALGIGKLSVRLPELPLRQVGTDIVECLRNAVLNIEITVERGVARRLQRYDPLAHGVFHLPAAR